MALGRAIIAGGIAAIGLPMAMKFGPESNLGDFVEAQSVHFQVFGTSIRWSWTIFAVVTLFAWIAFKAAKGR